MKLGYNQPNGFRGEVLKVWMDNDRQSLLILCLPEPSAQVSKKKSMCPLFIYVNSRPQHLRFLSK